MLTENELKQRLEDIAKADYPAPGEEEAPVLLEAMKAYLGTTDPILRDDLIYSTLAHWIVNDRLNEEQVRDLMNTALDDQHLFYRIDEADRDGIFTRSFSMLLLAPIIDAHCRHPFLTSEEVKHLKEQVLLYAGRETDLRGYVEGPGWAHAVAHTSDTLDELARCRELDREDLLDLLAGVYRFIANEDQVYHHEEDERMSVAVARILGRRLLTSEDWKEWLDSLVAFAIALRPFPQKMYARVNVKHLLRSLYFRLRREGGVPGADQDQTAALVQDIEQALASVAPF